MKIQILNEFGYSEAIFGLSLSYGTPRQKAEEVALKLCNQDHGHNKFLEMIDVWLDITAPRYWWQEADTYRLSTKQSESTMHTIHKRNLTQDDFEGFIESTTLNWLNSLINNYNLKKDQYSFLLLKCHMPEGFLQRRIWKLSYKNLREILIQRSNHRLPEWREIFCPYILSNVEHPELLTK